jgi:hypothetical protein
MIALETLQQIDRVASHHHLHPQDVRDFLSMQLPSWITPEGQIKAQALLRTWLDPDIDLHHLMIGCTNITTLTTGLEATDENNPATESLPTSKLHLSAERSSPYNQLAEQRAKKNFTQRLVERFGF